MKHALQRIHFTGIGGAGMSGIAELLVAQGYQVSGSDQGESDTTRRLRSLGVTVQIGHAAANVGAAQVLVKSSAIKADNPELMAAHQQHIPVLLRAQMLAELMRPRMGIAVAGTHGKTTTTSLLTTVLLQAGLEPGYAIGGQLLASGANAALGRGPLMVVEADESDASFLHLLPQLAIVTNIDADHMDTYGHDMARLRQAFVDFLHRMPFWGAAVLCGDDAGVRSIVPMLSRPVIRYGLDVEGPHGEDLDVRAIDIQADAGGQMRFTALRRDRQGVERAPLAVQLRLAGRHNVLNALAVIAMAMELGVADDAVLQGLAGFSGVGRRFQSYGELPVGDGTALLIDDYGHHPVEMKAVLAAARGAYPGRRLVLAFQPHRYTRTRDCFDEFAAVMAQADAVLLTDIYAASEAPLPGISGESLAQAVNVQGCPAAYVGDWQQLPQALADQARDGDVLIVMGAGSIAAVPARTVELMTQGKGRP
ncbi:UDP-N-acetylmuramate--L-alanine ligase [Roseateles depolymerans]|uniref:UDP-N-acetylmuramate--L-alanine ligase n=1 Tax=Roseateles depolymerans TaxID=76731 RepID=A0A0U3CWK1_9BURK|nr:UDP-N-acetylmuramate--L-alanine ligase [Roseateles depolymerans]ALV05718.1 UDP-N-acetylmuramate--alanine ligase [Roseateles depolymerans]REG13012.1 UDP-N-acetylmuramate--L-alanine ligase [Roseateles depolymerans]